MTEFLRSSHCHYTFLLLLDPRCAFSAYRKPLLPARLAAQRLHLNSPVSRQQRVTLLLTAALVNYMPSATLS